MQSVLVFHNPLFTKPTIPRPFLTIPIQKCFDQLLVYVNLNQHAKNQAISFICSGDMVEKKSCNLIGLENFGPYLRNQNFPKYGIGAGKQQIIFIFIIEHIQ